MNAPPLWGGFLEATLSTPCGGVGPWLVPLHFPLLTWSIAGVQCGPGQLVEGQVFLCPCADAEETLGVGGQPLSLQLGVSSRPVCTPSPMVRDFSESVLPIHDPDPRSSL